MPDPMGMFGPEQPPFPSGASLFADPQQAPLQGHFFRLAAGTAIPPGMDIVADGADVDSNSMHPPTHHTLFPTVQMPSQRFVSACLAVAVFREKTVTANASSMIWNEFVVAFLQGGKSSPAFNAVFEKGVDRVALVREALSKPGGNNRAAAVALMQEMSIEEQQQLFPELVQLARAAHGPVAVVRKIVAALPRQWVLARIDMELGRILEEQQYDDYWMFIELLEELDHERAVKLAQRAATAADPDLRELGKDMLTKFNES